ncbi:hypothetical protein K438DRAFT_583286 [Mycena galopus ATCC 62051]|nr:hypothetical protein K438DRAFT_583286 [Mycena galopus ATCC 62051]
MTGSELSLRHLPDLSDISFSFQIPMDSGDDLLCADSDDFFGGGTSTLASPSALPANDAPLTLGDLQATPVVIPKAPQPIEVKKVAKSLLPTTRSNIQDFSGSQINSRVPKPVAASHRKPKHVVLDTPMPSTGTPTEDEGVILAEPTSNRDVSNVALTDIPASLSHPLSDDFSFQLPGATPAIFNSIEDTPMEPRTTPVEQLPVSGQQRMTVNPSVAATEATTKPSLKSKKASTFDSVATARSTADSHAYQPILSGGICKPTAASNARPKLPEKTRASAKTAALAGDAENKAGSGAPSSIAERLLMYGAQMITSFPQSDSEDTPSHGVRAAAGDAAMSDNRICGGKLTHGQSDGDDTSSHTVRTTPGDVTMSDNAMGGETHEASVGFVAPVEASPSCLPSHGETIDIDNRMAVDSEPQTSPGAKLESEVAAHERSPVLQPVPFISAQDPLTLSQLSPRKNVVSGDDTNGDHPQVQREGAISPMRPSVKRPSSAASVEPGVRSKKLVSGAPRVPSVVASRGGGRIIRGRGGARVVSAPAPGRKQPGRKAREAMPQLTAGPRRAASISMRPKIATGSSHAAAKIDKLAGGSTVGSSSLPPNAGMRKVSVPVEFNVQSTAAVRAEKGRPAGLDSGEMPQPRPKAYTIPDFKAMHASLAAQGTLRRSQVAPTIPVPIAFNTDIRAKEREAFDEKLREKEREREAVREIQRREREEEEAKELMDLRKRAVPKAHEVPDWYKEAPKRNQGSGQ